MNKDKYYNIKIMNKGYGKTYHELQMIEKQHQRINGKLREEITKLEQENERLNEILVYKQVHEKEMHTRIEKAIEILKAMKHCDEWIGRKRTNIIKLLHILQNGSEKDDK